MTESNETPDETQLAEYSRALLAEEATQHKVEVLSRKWGDRLDDFHLPCPLCRGQLEFEGVTRGRLYEFAAGEPGVVTPQDVFPLTFVCDSCGYSVEFDAELFNPAYLARQSGAPPERVAELMTGDYRVLVLLRGDERSHTALDLATAVAGERAGDVVVLDAAQNDRNENQLIEHLQRYRPAVGDPAPVFVVRKGPTELKEAVPEILNRQSCNLMLLNAKNWSRSEETEIVAAINKTLANEICDVGLIFDRGLQQAHRILLATSGGPSAVVAAPVALDLARAFDAELHLLYVAKPGDPEGAERGKQHLNNTLQNSKIEDTDKIHRHIITRDDPVQTIIDEANQYHLLIMGGSPRSLVGRIRLDTLSARIARNASATAIVVLAQKRRRTWLGRLFER